MQCSSPSAEASAPSDHANRLFVLRLLVCEALAGPIEQMECQYIIPDLNLLIMLILNRRRKMYTYATYSPSFRPTISSVTWISTYVLPLCTANRRPTKFGRMVAARFVVRIGGVLGGGGRVRGRGRLFWTIESAFCSSMIYPTMRILSRIEDRAGLVSVRHGLDVTYGTMFGPVTSVSVWFLRN